MIKLGVFCKKFLACSFALALLILFCIPVSFASEDQTATEVTDVPSTTVEASESILTSVSPITPNNTNGFKSILLSLFGNYDTIVTEHRYTNSNGYTSVSIDIEPDHVWIAACCVFTVVLYCLFRFLGGFFGGRK